MDYPGVDGFLGTRASIMLDVVFTAMFAVVPVLAWSIWLVKYRQRWELHKRIQLVLLGTLAVAVTLFEIDMRLVSGWRERAMPSPYYNAVSNSGMERVPGAVFHALAVHLLFAVSTSVLWVWTAARALKRFPKPAAPNDYSLAHRFWGRLAAADMLLTRSAAGSSIGWRSSPDGRPTLIVRGLLIFRSRSNRDETQSLRWKRSRQQQVRFRRVRFCRRTNSLKHLTKHFAMTGRTGFQPLPR